MRNRINYVTWQEGIKKREINLQFSLPLFGRIKKWEKINNVTFEMTITPLK